MNLPFVVREVVPKGAVEEDGEKGDVVTFIWGSLFCLGLRWRSESRYLLELWLAKGGTSFLRGMGGTNQQPMRFSSSFVLRG